MKKCEICGEIFEKHSLYANHIRWKHKDNSEFKKKIGKNTIKTNEKMYGKWINENVKCSVCGEYVEIRYRENKKKEKYFCSISCANKRKHSKETKKKISESVSLLWNDEDYRNNMMNRVIVKSRRNSSIGERDIRYKLKDIYSNKDVISHYRIKYKNMDKTVDIYIPSKNTIIEYDGDWHFRKIMKDHDFEKTKKRDSLIKEYCNVNGVRLIRIYDKLYLSDKDKYFNLLINKIDKSEKQYIEIYK